MDIRERAARRVTLAILELAELLATQAIVAPLGILEQAGHRDILDSRELLDIRGTVANLEHLAIAAIQELQATREPAELLDISAILDQAALLATLVILGRAERRATQAIAE